jgi:hypothetical protein
MVCPGPVDVPPRHGKDTQGRSTRGKVIVLRRLEEIFTGVTSCSSSRVLNISDHWHCRRTSEGTLALAHLLHLRMRTASTGVFDVISAALGEMYTVNGASLALKIWSSKRLGSELLVTRTIPQRCGVFWTTSFHSLQTRQTAGRKGMPQVKTPISNAVARISGGRLSIVRV